MYLYFVRCIRIYIQDFICFIINDGKRDGIMYNIPTLFYCNKNANFWGNIEYLYK